MKVAFLWHMHQPMYAVPLSPNSKTKTAALPWVFVHGIREYFDMAEVVLRTVKSSSPSLTFNLVPSLIVQLEGYVNGTIEDLWLETFKKSAEDLTDEDVEFIRSNFFSLNFKNFIAPYPRFLELFEARKSIRKPSELRDLQVWWLLSQMSVFKQRESQTVRRLIEKGRNFDEDDKSELLEEAIKTIDEALGLYRKLEHDGVVEISTTPFYHPILPLLVDIEIAKVSMPHAPMPTAKFAYPEDAELHVSMALDFMKEHGFDVNGIWPSEGSVSEDVLSMLSKLGVKWAATDQGILERSHPSGHHYRPFEFKGVRLAFRDHLLSDLVGFSYYSMRAEDAVEDFVARLARIERKFGHDSTVFVILDGENAWASYPNGGIDFLTKLYERVQQNFDLVSVGKAVTESEAEILNSLFPGSWINSDFSMWVGEPHKNAACDLLADVRAQFENVPLSAAGRELMAAEGSDWFWWMGESMSEFVLEFDRIFRLHLAKALEFSGKAVPQSVNRPLAELAAKLPEFKPSDFISPKIDGQNSNFFEWIHAAEIDFRRYSGGGSMARGILTLSKAYIGYDKTRLYIRIDPSESLSEILKDRKIVIELEGDAGKRLTLKICGSSSGKESIVADGVNPDEVVFAARKIIELAIPLNFLKGVESYRVRFSVLDRNGIVLEQHPPVGWFKVSAAPEEWPV